MKYLALILATAIIAVATLKTQPVIAVIAAFACLYFYFKAYREMQKTNSEGRQQILTTDTQLRTELTATHQLVLAKLSTAEDELKNKVIELLVEAGKHLGNPVTNSRLVYGPEFYIKWNRDGLALVAQARQLIEEYTTRVTAH